MGICKSKKQDGDSNINTDNSDKSKHRTENCRQISSNLYTIDTTRIELNRLLLEIDDFKGTTADDKNYRYLDEMLTRCILKLDAIECNNLSDRSNRKETIKGINRALSILEKKLEINTDIQNLESNLSGNGFQSSSYKSN